MYSTFAHIFALVDYMSHPTNYYMLHSFTRVKIYNSHFTSNCKSLSLKLHAFAWYSSAPSSRYSNCGGALCIQRTLGYEPNCSQIYLDCCNSLPCGYFFSFSASHRISHFVAPLSWLLGKFSSPSGDSHGIFWTSPVNLTGVPSLKLISKFWLTISACLRASVDRATSLVFSSIPSSAVVYPVPY